MEDFSTLIPLVRHLVYDGLAEVFTYRVRDNDWNELLSKLEEYAKLDKDIKDQTGFSFNEILEKLREAGKGKVAVEYSTLFDTGIGARPLNPVESIRLYSLVGESAATFKLRDLRRFYAKYGLNPNIHREFREAEDHISMVFAFMSHLCDLEYRIKQEKRAVDDVVRDQRNFMVSHIKSWIPELMDDVINDKRSEVFKVVGKNVKSWVKFDSLLLGGE